MEWKKEKWENVSLTWKLRSQNIVKNVQHLQQQSRWRDEETFSLFLVSGGEAEIEIIHHIYAPTASESRFWRLIRASATSWMGAGVKAKKGRVQLCTPQPPHRGSGGEKHKSGEPGSLSKGRGSETGLLWTRFHQLPSENKPGSVRGARLSAGGHLSTLHQQDDHFLNIMGMSSKGNVSDVYFRRDVKTQSWLYC